jgi:arylsulfatase A
MIPFLRLLATLALGGFVPSTTAAPATDRPNFIFILADDLAQGDLGCYGQKLIQTPHLDRMAAQGTRFTQAYSGTSVCAPSRASLMTGLHMGHCPVRGNREIAKGEGQMPLPARTLTVAELLKQGGYATACTGKWGMGMFATSGSPLKKGFDHFFGYNCQRHAHSYFPDHLYDDDRRIGLKPGTYAQDLIQADTLAWVRKHKDQPFFLFYAVTLPHAKYEIDDLGDYRDKPWTPQQKTYAAMVSRLDSDVGKLLATLAELGIDQRTLVMIAGDNGSSFDPSSPLGKHFNQGGTGLRGYKRGLYEGGLRQAAIARWPGMVPAGRVADGPWAFWDYLPTVATLAGIDLPKGCEPDGLPLVDYLKGGDAPEREYFYWELHEGKPIQALRFGDWKAVRKGPGEALELYDLKRDPGETKDLAARHPDVVARAQELIGKARHDDPAWPMGKGNRAKPAVKQAKGMPGANAKPGVKGRPTTR